MVRDLFHLNLEKLNYSDIELFTNIMGPEDKRPQESIRIDYKEKITENIGDTVTAFANTYGGLLLLGVRSDKTKQNIPVEITGFEGAGDTKALIANKILSTVYPRPSFSIGIVPHTRNPKHIVSVIRIDESTLKPHIFTKGNLNKISVRIEDENRYASFQEIEAFFQNRNKRDQKIKNRIETLEPLWISRKSEHGDTRTNTYHSTIFVSSNELNFHLDRNTENEFKTLVRKTFPKDHGPFEWKRRSDRSDLVDRNLKEDFHRIWRIQKSGVIGFISQIEKGGPSQAILGDIISDTISAFKLCKEFLENHQYYGKIIFIHELSIGDLKIIKNYSPKKANGTYDEMPGINLDHAREVLQVKHSNKISTTLEMYDFEDPAEIIARHFLDHLRMTTEADVDFSRLIESVRDLF